MDVLLEDIKNVCDLIMERARDASGFYVSVDIDCVDPAFAPGTGYLEPSGLSSSDLIYFLKRLRLLKNFRGGDVVEINPSLDFNGMTVKLGAKLLAEMI
jgi:arginase family enzyme